MVNNNGYNVLDIASFGNEKDMCKMFIDFGADVNQESEFKTDFQMASPLNLSVIIGKTDACQLLIEKGAYVNHQ